MDSFGQNNNSAAGSSKLFWGILIVGLLLVGGAIAYFLQQPSPEVQEVRLENAVREGDQQFAELTKRVVVEPDLNYTEEATSPIGDLQMTLAGLVRNFSGKTLTGLEVVGSVVDQKGNVVKEKKAIIIPGRTDRLENSKVMPIRITIAGFSRKDDRANIKWRVTALRVE